MATRGGLTSYLALCIQTLRGFWSRAGDPVSRPKVLTPRRDWRAQPTAPYPAWGFGLQTSVRGFQQTVAGMPTAALPDLMMSDGPDRVRALFLHGGAWRAPCMFRQSALATPDRAGVAWRKAFTSPSLPGGARRLGPEAGLPPAPETPRQLCLHDGRRALQPASSRLRAIIAEILPGTL